MAGVVKGVQQVVSSCPSEPSPVVCVTPNSNQCDAFNSDSRPVVDNFSFSADVNNKDLLGFNPPSDDTSLQDLIDSELALRISGSALDNGDDAPQADADSNSPPRSLSPEMDSVGLKPVMNGNGNVITDFLEQERSHTESASSVSSPAAPLCSGDDFDDLLGSEPADSDFSPNIPLADADANAEDAKNDNADEATLAEDISFASDKSQERGSLLDLDSPEEREREQQEPEREPEAREVEVEGPGEQRGEEKVEVVEEACGEEEHRPSAEEEEQPAQTRPLPRTLPPFQDEEESAQAEPVRSVFRWAQDAQEAMRAELDPADLDLDLVKQREQQQSEDREELEARAPDLPDLPDPCNPSGVNNSMDVLASAVPAVPAPGAPVAPSESTGVGFEDGFETWSTVEEAVAESSLLDSDSRSQLDVDQDAVQVVERAALEPEPRSRREPSPDPEPVESDTETMSETSDKKVSKKKKMEGGDSTSTKKKTKKTKKSDAEKENISVMTNGYCINGHAENEVKSRNGVSPSDVYADHSIVEDDLSNVCVKELKSAYTTLTKTETAKEPPKDLRDVDRDIVYCGPIQNLKQTYCSEASRRYNGTRTPNKTERIATGISIRDLRRSFGDLRNCENTENGVHFSPEEEISNEAKTRSLGDLRRFSRDLYRPKNDTTSCLRKPIHTGVSVKALRASYCSLVNLSDPAVSDCRRALSSSDVSQPYIAKSSFSKFDQLSKKTVLHVRSVDASKVQKQFNESATSTPESQSSCKSCGKQVFVMEQIKAEKAVWHKNCFRCKECSKQLTVDTYSSNEGELYCKPHFRELFKPKAVVEDNPEPLRRRKPELIIRENQPVELPPDVFRASDKPDLGLEELSSLNVKSRFQVFEKTEDKSADVERSPSTVNVKRSPSILSKLAKFQAKGMDVGVTDDSLNGIPYEESSTSSEEESEEGEGDEENGDIVKSSRKTRERPMSFSKMEDVKSRWETGSAARKEERREERKQEIQSIRSRLFMGKQGKMKEMYEQAVKESEQPAARKGAEVRSEKAKSIKEKFERGETLVSDEEEDDHDGRKMKDEDSAVFEAGISKKSRSLFMELDATAAKTGPLSPSRPTSQRKEEKTREVLVNRQVSDDVVKASDKLEDVQVETADISSKFKFFETYKEPEKQKKAFRITPPREGQVKTESPEREIYRDPDVVRAEDRADDDELQHSMTTSKMLSIFRQMEEKAQREDVPDGPKPLKCFTPPPDYTRDSGSSEEESSEEEESEEEEDEAQDGIIRSSDKTEDEFLKAAKEAAKAKTLKAKFEHWEEQENNINNGGGNINPTLLESEHESIESTKSLRARFESLKHEAEAPKEKPRPKVNRFVEIQTSCAEYCDSCQKKVYPLEKVETGGKLFHKGCFRCMQCSCVLRMESYTLNNGKLYCIPHFKQLFISKGNYDEGFGLDQHKRKWNSTMRDNGDILLSGIDANGNSH